MMPMPFIDGLGGETSSFGTSEAHTSSVPLSAAAVRSMMMPRFRQVASVAPMSRWGSGPAGADHAEPRASCSH
jgi:hypothetical protein